MPSPVIFSYTILDTNGVRTSTPLYSVMGEIAYTPNYVDFVYEWGRIGNFIDNMIDGQIVGGHILIPCAPVAGMKTAPVAGNDVSDVGSFKFKNAVTRYSFSLLIPSISASVMNGAQIDLSNVAVSTFRANMLDYWAGNETGAIGYWTNNDGQTLSAFVSAQQVDQKHRKKLTAASKVTP